MVPTGCKQLVLSTIRRLLRPSAGKCPLVPGTRAPDQLKEDGSGAQ